MSEVPNITTDERPNRFGPKRLSPHADFINSKHRLDYAITDLVQEFCEHHDLTADKIQIVVTYSGCFAKVTL